MKTSSNPKVAIIDYHMGNLFSIQRACEIVGLKSIVTSDKLLILRSDGIILPGVGAFGDAVDCLQRLDLVGPIKAFIDMGKPFMGICLGMQLLMRESEEFGTHNGLGVIEGVVKRFRDNNDHGKRIKVPQIGWNNIYEPDSVNKNLWDSSPLKGIDAGEYMYFAHSYFAVPESQEVVLSVTDYEGNEFCSSILKRNIFACQYHPEKSTHKGLVIYKNFADYINEES